MLDHCERGGGSDQFVGEGLDRGGERGRLGHGDTPKASEALQDD